MTIIIGGIIAITLLIPNTVLSIQPAPSDDTSTSKIEILSNNNDPSHECSSDRDEILWLARAIYSETKDEKEMYLIAWVIRNRVENHYWNDCTYEAVVNRPKQFSGLNSTDPQYKHNMSLTHGHTYITWQTALEVAENVYYAESSKRPFSKYIQHFYSPEVVEAPEWAEHEKLAFVSHDTNDGTVRFAFYKEIK
ncbi:MAG: cell wall hydrolase [Candidatus Pacebacteria bacterium]|nr:cell wall hydrolase [Candidatus Paceibacterota bacterium]